MTDDLWAKKPEPTPGKLWKYAHSEPTACMSHPPQSQEVQNEMAAVLYMQSRKSWSKKSPKESREDGAQRGNDRPGTATSSFNPRKVRKGTGDRRPHSAADGKGGLHQTRSASRPGTAASCARLGSKAKRDISAALDVCKQDVVVGIGSAGTTAGVTPLSPTKATAERLRKTISSSSMHECKHEAANGVSITGNSLSMNLLSPSGSHPSRRRSSAPALTGSRRGSNASSQPNLNDSSGRNVSQRKERLLRSDSDLKASICDIRSQTLGHRLDVGSTRAEDVEALNSSHNRAARALQIGAIKASEAGQAADDVRVLSSLFQGSVAMVAPESPELLAKPDKWKGFSEQLSKAFSSHRLENEQADEGHGSVPAPDDSQSCVELRPMERGPSKDRRLSSKVPEPPEIEDLQPHFDFNLNKWISPFESMEESRLNPEMSAHFLLKAAERVRQPTRTPHRLQAFADVAQVSMTTGKKYG